MSSVVEVWKNHWIVYRMWRFNKSYVSMYLFAPYVSKKSLVRFTRQKPIRNLTIYENSIIFTAKEKEQPFRLRYSVTFSAEHKIIYEYVSCSYRHFSSGVMWWSRILYNIFYLQLFCHCHRWWFCRGFPLHSFF